MGHARPRWEQTIKAQPKRVAVAGYAAMILMAATFGAWAVSASIDSAAVAPGAVAAAGRNIQLQHLEGGIVKSINVEEGDRIQRDQIIMLLDDTAPLSQLNRLLKQWVGLSVRIARLEAERDGKETMQVTLRKLADSDQIEINRIITQEAKEFDARYTRYRSELQILGQRLSRLNETVVGLDAQKQAVEAQAAIVDGEVERKRGLVDQGLTIRSEYSDLLRMQADLLGQAGALSAERTATYAQIAEAQEQIERLTTQRVEEAVTNLNEARLNIADVEEQILAARAVLQRTTVRAPVDGIVVTSIYNVVGNVIAPGERIMEILPTTDEPLIEARLRTTDIDIVHIGQEARVRLVALNARTTPEISATVQYISADRLIDKETQETYYRVLLKVADELPSGISSEQLYPGMPVEAFINAGERTFLAYLTKPLLDSMNRAFVEY